MGKSKDLATGASYVDTAGDTMSGDLSVTGADVTITGSTNTDATLNVLSPNWVTGAYADINIAYQPTSRKIRGHYDNGIEIFTNNTNAALKVDPTGRVTMPYQPLFRGYLASNESPNTNVTSAVLVGLTADENVGNHWNANTFTCPVAGRYLVSTFHIKYPVSGASHVDLYKNGAAVSHARWRGEETATYTQVGGSTIVTCAANDTLQWYYFGAAGLHSGNGNWTISLIG